MPPGGQELRSWADGLERADLLETVKRLAAPPDEQAAYVRRLESGPSADELGLEFDDEFVRLRADRGSEPVPPAYFCRLISPRRTAQADERPRERRLWVLEALDSPEWQRVRELARRGLTKRPR